MRGMELYQKLGVAVIRLSREFLGKEVGDKIKSINQYVEELQFSRGTIQNALAYILKDGAVSFIKRGHLGTYIEAIDYQKLQSLSAYKNVQGIMPLPYSMRYQGISTAIYKCLSDFDVNLVYSRGAYNRIKLIDEGIYQFAICSKFAAHQAIQEGQKIKVALTFSGGSYLSKHILLFRDESHTEISDGMKVAYDKSSIDQSEIVRIATKDKKNIQLVEMRTHQTIQNLLAGIIDVGVWNYDNLNQVKESGLFVVMIDEKIDSGDLSTAVLIIKKDEIDLEKFILKYITTMEVKQIQDDVIARKLVPNY